MKIATSYRSYNGESYTRWIDEVAAVGIRHMEIAVPELPSEPSMREEIFRYARAKGFALNLHAPYGVNNISSMDEECRLSSIANMKLAIDIAAEHSLGVVTFHPGRRSPEETGSQENYERMLEAVGEIADYAKQRQVRVGIENMEVRPNEYIHTVEDMNGFSRFAEGNPYFGVTFDFGHYASLGKGLPPLDTLTLPLVDVHLSRYFGTRAHSALITEDADELAEITRLLREYGYDGFVVLEVGDGVFESIEVLRKVLASVNEVAE